MNKARELLEKHSALFAGANRGDLAGDTYVAADQRTYSLPDTLKTIERELKRAARANKDPYPQTLRDLTDILAHAKGPEHAQD